MPKMPKNPVLPNRMWHIRRPREPFYIQGQAETLLDDVSSRWMTNCTRCDERGELPVGITQFRKDAPGVLSRRHGGAMGSIHAQRGPKRRG